jgi:trehalose synthase
MYAEERVAIEAPAAWPVGLWRPLNDRLVDLTATSCVRVAVPFPPPVPPAVLSLIEPQEAPTLAEYEAYLHLEPLVSQLRSDSERLVAKLKGRTVWMINSAAQGGGVAEMMPRLITLLRELGMDVRWVVIHPEEPRFFEITKHLHNLIHGEGDPHLGEDDRALYHRTSEELAAAFADRVAPQDVVVIHDPQPAAMGALLKEDLGVATIWRCHIGLDEQNARTEAAWAFLHDYLVAYDRTVFTLEEYVPSYLRDRSEIIHPAIDPLSYKNSPLRPHKLAGVLANAGLAASPHPVLTPPFATPAQRLQPDGTFATASMGEEIGLLYRPIVTQVSRWDRLKGWTPLLQAFAKLKRSPYRDRSTASERHRRRLDLVRLVLAGPEPDSIQDDPEGLEVFHEICGLWHELSPDLQRDVAVLSLPMASQKVNALMVNALQRCSTVVAQNSLHEGFGLTVTEAMWKEVPVLGSRAAGIRAQIVDQHHGTLVSDPSDSDEVAATLDAMLEMDGKREAWGRNAQRRVSEHFLVFTQARRWLEVLADERLAAGAEQEHSET